MKETLKPEQLKRLRQIELQQERGFALGQEKLVKELHITDEQRKQFVAITQEFQKKVQPLIKEAQSGGKPEEIRPKVLGMRDEYAKKLEAVLVTSSRRSGRTCSASRSTWETDRRQEVAIEIDGLCRRANDGPARPAGEPLSVFGR